MKFDITSTIGVALALQTSVAAAKHVHQAREHKHAHHNRHESAATSLQVREPDNGGSQGGQCQFPTNVGLVPVTPGSQNAGWAMSPNQPCLPGNYCPYACPSGQMMAQWDPQATSYTYPLSMNGGLYCDNSGQISKPFPNKPYCVTGTQGFKAVDTTGKGVAFCQTVLPGNEAMLIPTQCEGETELAIPDPSYWAGTAAHYYINPPGVSVEEACIWGTSANPVGNWSPYVAGGNTVSGGETFIKIGWNPIYLQPTTPFRNVLPTWGVEIQCEGGECNGLPCAIDPSKNGVNEMTGIGTDGAGGGAFCVVTVPAGASAKFVVFEAGDANASDSEDQDKAAEPASVSTTSTTTTTPTPTPTPSSSFTSTSATSTSTTSTTSSSLSSISSSASSSSSFSYSPHILLQNVTMAVPTAASSTIFVQTTLATGAGSTMPAMSPIASATPTGAGVQIRATRAGVALGLLAVVAALAL